jgi:aspartate racemase
MRAVAGAPSDAEQERVQAGISQIKAAAHDAGTRETFESIGARLIDRGAEAVILGCTEIPLAFDERSAGYPCVNATLGAPD